MPTIFERTPLVMQARQLLIDAAESDRQIQSALTLVVAFCVVDCLRRGPSTVQQIRDTFVKRGVTNLSARKLREAFTKLGSLAVYRKGRGRKILIKHAGYRPLPGAWRPVSRLTTAECG